MENPSRKLLVFGNGDCHMLQKQVEIFSKSKDEINERDIVIEKYCQHKENKNKFTNWKVPADSSFTLLLIGKDGGEKFRSYKLVSAKAIFNMIDAMPMRIQEMKSNRNQ